MDILSKYLKILEKLHQFIEGDVWPVYLFHDLNQILFIKLILIHLTPIRLDLALLKIIIAQPR